MTVSIIIAVKTWQKNLEECVVRTQGLDFSDFEVIILPDDDITGLIPDELKTLFSRQDNPYRAIPTGAVNPARKRDIALKYAKGVFLAFLDDDAYPRKDWLKNALKNFDRPEVAAVGGPAVTPEGSPLMEEASGLVFSSLIVSGKFTYRYLPQKKQEVEDYPSCNFLVRKDIMLELGGFDTDFWPGEDTKLCLEITKKLKKKIIYDPEVLVYHHRRRLFLEHLRQVASYALHRGYFVKKYPETSRRLTYFLPVFFVLGLLIAGGVSLFFPVIRIFYFSGLILYLLIVLFFSRAKGLRKTAVVSLGIISTHLAYGIYFLKGLLLVRLKEAV